MTINEIKEKIRHDEYTGERLINKFRFALGIIFVFSILIISILRNLDGLLHFPIRAYIFTTLFLVYSVLIYFYLKGRSTLPIYFKYICVSLDAILISAAIWMGSTYPELSPPIVFLSIQALFYIILIMAGSFRYSVSCAFFSGFFSGFCYLIVVFANGNVLDVPYSFTLSGKVIPVSFPLYNEIFRVIGMIVAGAIAGMACKRHLSLFNNMIESQTDAAFHASATVEKTRSMAKTIKKSTDEIFLSSKDIFTTANNTGDNAVIFHFNCF